MEKEQYDTFADDWLEARETSPLAAVVDHSLNVHLGDVSGKSILDLACGEGATTRGYKRAGAAEVVGCDISSELIRVAEEHEREEPLGIRYIAAPVQELGKVGEFDIVTAAFLLHYSPSYDELVAMCQVIYDNLKPGQAYVAMNDNCGEGVKHPDSFRKYGLAYGGEAGAPDATPVKLHIQAGPETWLDIDIHTYGRETYDRALSEAGFREVSWHTVSIPDNAQRADDPHYWDTLLELEPVVVLVARK